MKSSAKAGSPCLGPDFKRKAFNVSLFPLVMGLVGTLEEVKEIPLCSQFAQKWAVLVLINHEWLVNLTRSFLAPTEMTRFSPVNHTIHIFCSTTLTFLQFYLEPRS